MKILHVCDHIDPSLGGGAAERTYQWAKALGRAGQECTVLCTDQGLGERRRQELSDVRLLAVPTRFERFLIPQLDSAQLRDLVESADLLHITGHWSVLGARAGTMALRLRRPYVYCPAGSLRIFGRSRWLKQLYNQVAGRRLVQEADRCVAVTALEKEQFHEYGVPDSRITILSNGVQPDPGLQSGSPERFRERLGLGDGPLLLFLGRLSPIKGPDLLLQAFQRIAALHSTTHLVFAGPQADLGAQLQRQVDESGLGQRVHFAGYLTGQDKQDALTSANLLVIPSRLEAMSLVALEAGLCGTPVLLTDQCGFEEVQTVAGGRVVAVDAGAIAHEMSDMLYDLVDLRAMGERLRHLVLTHYTWDSLTQRALDLYRTLVD